MAVAEEAVRHPEHDASVALVEKAECIGVALVEATDESASSAGSGTSECSQDRDEASAPCPCTRAAAPSDHRRRPTSDPSSSNVRREYVHVITIGGQVVKARIAVLVGALVATASVAVGASAAPSQPEAQSATIVGVAAGDKRFSTLVALVKQAGLVEDAEQQGAVHGLRADERRVRRAEEECAGHLQRRRQRQEAADEGAHVPRARGQGRQHRCDRRREEEGVGQDRPGREDQALAEGRKALLNGSSQVIVADVKTSNGVIHAINAVIVPPSSRSEAPTQRGKGRTARLSEAGETRPRATYDPAGAFRSRARSSLAPGPAASRAWIRSGCCRVFVSSLYKSLP